MEQLKIFFIDQDPTLSANVFINSSFYETPFYKGVFLYYTQIFWSSFINTFSCDVRVALLSSFSISSS